MGRLIDYGYHAPTMSWPVTGTLMVEPGELDAVNNPLKNAPHTQAVVMADEWKYPYTREMAAYPISYLKEMVKFWPTTSRVDNVFGDRNLQTTLCCDDVSSYAQAEE